MSGSGGYSKYRCKYWATHNCDNWVWINGRACVWCIAAGRDDDVLPPQQRAALQMASPREICLPSFHDGRITYIIMEVLGIDQAGNYSLRVKAAQQPMIHVPTTNSMPGVPSTGKTIFGTGYH